ESLHRALDVDRAQAADMRFWHWLTTTELREFVLLRWLGHIPATFPVDFAWGRLPERFLGRFNLHDVSHNALARLWWVAEALSDNGNYDLARKALVRQDLFQAIFERELGMYSPAARAAIKMADQVSEEVWRERMRRLRYYATTISLE